MDGFEATRLIKESRPQVRAIVPAMYAEYQDAALAAGADAFVGKGEVSDALLGILAAILEGPQAAR